MYKSYLRFIGGAENVFGMAQRPHQQQQQEARTICRPVSNPVGPRCAAAGRMMPWERPRPRPEGQFNHCEPLREGIASPQPRLNLGQVHVLQSWLFVLQCSTVIWTPLFGVLIGNTN